MMGCCERNSNGVRRGSDEKSPESGPALPRRCGEMGPNFKNFRSASACTSFASFMALRPDTDISGGKVLWTGTHKVNCRAGNGASRAGAVTAPQQQCSRRLLRAKLGAHKAITAAAHKLARIMFHPFQLFSAKLSEGPLRQTSRRVLLSLVHTRCAPVAQLDRARASGARGQRFESSRAYHSLGITT